jgi:hypothetical protein
MPEETRVFASVLYRNNVVPFCSTLAVRIIKMNTITSLSLKLPRTSCVWDMNLPTTKTFESVLLCLHIFVCFVSWERTGTSYLDGYLHGVLYAWRAVSLFVFLCFNEVLSLSCLRGWINFLFATRWSTPFI